MSPFEQYALLKADKERIEKQLTKINRTLVKELQKTGEKKRVYKFGSFQLVKRTLWMFSPQIEIEKKRLEFLKKREIKTGKANHKEIVYLKFNEK